jgi:Domain of unknown function (DUF4258)
MQHLRMTRHARQRLQQRGSRPKDVAIVMTYGDIEVPAREGCRYVQLSHREAARLQREGGLKASEVDKARRLVVLADPDGRVVTVLKCSPERRVSSRRAGARR